MLLAVNARADSEPYSESGTFLVNTSAPRIDTDGDGMPDAYENSVGLNRLFNDAYDDPDGDGLTNLEEYNAGSSPLLADFPQLSQAVSVVFTVSTKNTSIDADGDGMPDDWELAQGLDPFRDDANEDSDADGLTNLQEYNGGTSPLSNDSPAVNTGVSALFAVNTAIYSFSLTTDTDGDGMPDWWEQEYGLNPLVNDADADADRDGVLNFAEYHQGRNPSLNESVTEVAALSAAFTLNTRETRLDSDGDGIPDSWEIVHGLDAFRNDANEDPDGDGRINLEEYNAGTNPQVDDWRGPSSAVSVLFVADTGGIIGPRTRDTDADGIPDWWEIQYGLNPNVNDANGDSDGDGSSNLEEYNSGSNPAAQDRPSVIGISGIFLVDTGGRSFDSDADGLPDWWEKLYFNDPRTANPLSDTDGDGQLNYAEFLAGSNPLDPHSVFRIEGYQATRQTNGMHVVIRWASFEGSTYSIWSATLVQCPYSLVATNIAATPPVNTFSGTLASSNGFFRVGAAR